MHFKERFKLYNLQIYIAKYILFSHYIATYYDNQDAIIMKTNEPFE